MCIDVCIFSVYFLEVVLDEGREDNSLISGFYVLGYVF